MLVGRHSKNSSGFTLVELMIVVVIIGILAVLVLPNLFGSLEKSRVAEAIAEIHGIQTEIESFRAAHDGGVPIDWGTFHKGQVPKDPWGRDYIFNSFNSTLGILPILPPGISNGLNTTLARRRNGALAPINSNYDLFSVGLDGDWMALLIASVSQDDVILANDGSYIGLAEDY